MSDRTELRAANASFETASLVSRALTENASYAMAAPAVLPADDIKARFEYALTALTHQDWKGFAADCASTVAAAPAAFATHLIAGICEYVIDELKGIAEIGMTVVGFVSEYAKCTWDIGPDGLIDPDQILRSEQCIHFHDAAMASLSIQEFAGQLEKLGAAGVQELAREVLPVVMEVFATVLEDGLILLGDQRAAIEAWMRETAHDAAALGRMVGTLTGSILLELATAGVARALKTARWVNRLPGAPLIGLAVPDAPTLSPMAVVGVSRQGQLDELADLFFLILRKNHKRFSKNLTLAKVRVLRKHVPAEALAKFARRRRLLSLDLATGFHRHKGVIKPYSQSLSEVQTFNRRVLTYHYADAALDEDLDYFNILARKDAILPNVFESNHIFEERMFHARKYAWSNEMKKLGWSSPADMEAVLMTADEHTGSVRRMLLRYGLPLEEVEAIEPPVSMTRILLDKIRLREQLDSTPDADVLIVDADTPFIQVLTKYAELYKKNSGDLWNRSLRAQFNAWRAALGLSEPVYR